jgi:hypothetical protein
MPSPVYGSEMVADKAGEAYFDLLEPAVDLLIRQSLIDFGYDQATAEALAQDAASEMSAELARLVGQVVQQHTTGGSNVVMRRRYYVKDHLGSVRAVMHIRVDGAAEAGASGFIQADATPNQVQDPGKKAKTSTACSHRSRRITR